MGRGMLGQIVEDDQGGVDNHLTACSAILARVTGVANRRTRKASRPIS